MNLTKGQLISIKEKLKEQGYDLLGVIGKGGDGEVFLIQNTITHKQRAAKCFHSDEIYNRLSRKHLNLCDNLVPPLECIKVNDGLFVYIMEKCRSVSVRSVQSEKLLKDILDGIEQLLKKGLYQSDEFEGNILVRNNGKVAISDFSSWSIKNSSDVVVKDQIEKMLKYVSTTRNIKKFKNFLNYEDKIDIDKLRAKIKEFNFFLNF